MKLLRLMGIFILLLLALLIGGTAYLTLTETGTQWLLAQVARVVPGELQTRQVEGYLGKALTLTGLRYHSPDFTLEIEHFHFAWRPAALLEAAFEVERLHLREVNWHQKRLREPETPEEPLALPEIQLPLKVRAESVRLQNLSLHPLESPPAHIDAIVLQGNFDGQALQLTKLGIAAPQGHLLVSGGIAFQEAYPMEFVLGWRAPVPDLGKVSGTGKVEGNLRQLTVHQKIHTPFMLQFRSRLFDLLGQLRWAAVLEVPETELQQLSGQWPALRLGLNLKGAGGLERFKVRGAYQIQAAQVGRLSGKFAGKQLAMGHWALEQLTMQQLQGSAHLTLQGEAALAEGQPQFTLAGAWRDLAWPLTGTPQASSERGRLSLAGTAENYRLEVSSALAGQDIPTSTWYLAGLGDSTQFGLEKLEGRLLDGSVAGSGNVRWAPALAWQLQLKGKSLNLAAQWPEWPGVLSFSTVTRGVLEDSGPAMMVDLKTLSGSLRGYPVAAHGKVQGQNSTWRITDLEFRSGDSRLAIGGTISERLALDWRLASPDLSQLLPEARGDLTAEGHLGGPLQQPALDFHLQGKKLAYQDFQVASVASDVNVDGQGNQPSRLWFKATDLILAGQTLRSLGIQGSGTPAQHELSLAVEAPERSLSLGLQGSWREAVWEGELTKTRIADPMMGQWETVAPTPLTLSRDSIALAPWCWQRQPAQFCLGGSWRQGGDWQGSFDIKDFSLALLAPLLPEKTVLEGSIAGRGQVQGEAHQLLQAQLQLGISAGHLIQAMPEGEPLRFPHQGVQAKLRLQEEGGEASVQLLLADPSAAPVKASLRLPPAPLDLTALEQMPLAGAVTMAFDDLSFLALLLPELQAVEGQLRVDLELGGQVAAPQLFGQIVLQEGSAQVLPLGLELTGIRLRAEASERGKVTFKGGVHSGEGRLAINGQAHLDPEAGWPVKATVAGRRFEAMNSSDIRVLVSPQLQLTVAEEGIRVTGEVAIPEATVVVKDIAKRGGVPVSRDVVIISQEKQAEAQAMPIYARVRIVLGDQVRVEAFGFKGGIAGNLLVTETPGKITRGSGELRIVEGQYKAYGQDLSIQQGQVIFAGPVDKPRLNVEAVRQVGEVLAGIQIKGLADAPVLTLFSEPPMNEDNILAYLILGRPLSTASGEEGSALANAATSLGLSGGNFLAKRIGKTFGLEEVGIETVGASKEPRSPAWSGSRERNRIGAAGANEQTQNEALMLGKHLSPRLYVGYGIGIFKHFNAFRMRYTLSKYWNLQAETGLESGIDLFYNLER